MANVTNTPGVIGPLDTAADNIIATGNPVIIRKAVFLHPTAAGTATLTDAGGAAIKLELAAGAGFTDAETFDTKPLILNGLRLLAIAAGGVVYLYTDAY